MADPAAPVGPEPGGLGATRTGGGPRVVLVHGFTQSHQSWARVTRALSGAHEVVCVDLPGHAASARVVVRDLDEAAGRLGATGGRAAYVAYSLGGRTALTLALARPDLVGALVLVGATAGIEDAAERAERRQADEALAARLEAGGDAGLAGFLDDWLAGPLFAHLTAEQADRRARLANTAAGLAASLRACGAGTQVPTWDRLGELSMPVLVVAGERDHKFAGLGERLVAGIGPNARLALVEGAGHAAPFEAPGAFVDLVEDFLAGPGPRVAAGRRPPRSRARRP